MVSSLNVGDSIYTEPIIDGNDLFVSTENGTIRKVTYDQVTNQFTIIWEKDMNQRLTSPLAVVNHRLCVGGEKGLLLQLDIENGELVQQTKLKHAPQHVLEYNGYFLLLSNKGQVDLIMIKQ